MQSPRQSPMQAKNNHVTLSGPLTLKTVPAWFEKTPQFCAQPIRVDLAAVQEADSAGLALLVHWSKLARASSTPLQFTEVPPQLYQLAKIADLEELFAG